MNESEIMNLAHRVKMCVCNRLYDAAYQQIQQLSKMGVTMTVVDTGYNEWERQRNV